MATLSQFFTLRGEAGEVAGFEWESSVFVEIKRGSVRPYEAMLRRRKLSGTIDSANKR